MQTAGDAKRFRFIISEIWRSGLLRARHEKDFPARVRILFERLGPTFVKFGQMLSVRSDLVGIELASELSKLQRDAKPFALGKDYRELIAHFSSFEQKPFAAASLAQVHRAKLKNGTRVAVKIQRPGIRAIIEKDLHIMALLARLLEEHFPDIKAIRPMRLVREFADWTVRELDFEVEGSNIDRFRHNFAENPRVRVPRVFWQYSSREALVMELIEGTRIDDAGALKRKKINPRALAEVGIAAAFQQFFIDGFFHSDPHPGNFVALPGPVLVFHDFGQVGYLSRATRSSLVACLNAYLAHDTENYTAHLLELAEIGPESDVPAFRRDVQNVLDRVMYKPAAKKRVSVAFAEVFGLAVRNGIYFSTDLVLWSKALLTIEAVGRKLAPDFNLDGALQTALESSVKSELSPRRIAKDLQTELIDYVNFTRSLPERLGNVLKKVETGNLGVRLDFGELRDLKREFDRQNDERVLALVVVALFIGSAAILSSSALTASGLLFGRIGLVASGILFIWLIKQVSYKPS